MPLLFGQDPTATTQPLKESVRNACADPDKPTWLCETIGDLTGSSVAAGIAAWMWMYPLTILFILVVAFFVNRIVRYSIKRSLLRLLQPSERRQAAQRFLRRAAPGSLLRTGPVNLRLEARVQTLTTVFRSIASVLVWFVAILTCMQVIGVNLTSLVAISTIAGAAIGFGAQHTVRDFLAGMFIVLEDQFGVGDTVDIGNEAKGTVEELTLRTTRVRDVNGTLWHVPNGTIQRVANKSQAWARAVLDVEVDGGTQYAVAASIIQQVADDMAAEEQWAGDILGAPEVWGIEAFTESGYTVRLVIKTRPAEQFGVLRELRIRLLNAFTERGIVLPGGHWALEQSAAKAGGSQDPTLNGLGPAEDDEARVNGTEPRAAVGARRGGAGPERSTGAPADEDPAGPHPRRGDPGSEA
jgi:small-conductance mechanosensitive channel